MLVTGGTSGIGTAIVARLAGDGHAVAFTGRDAARGGAVAAQHGATFVPADARDPAAVDASIRSAAETLGGLDALVVNHGAIVDAPLLETNDEHWDALIETNVVAAFDYAVGALPLLERSGRGSITLIASDAGVWGEPSIGAYSITKRCAIMLAQMLAIEGGPRGVRANAVCPGDIEPGMRSTSSGYLDPAATTEGWLRPPVGRIGQAADVAGAVAYLVSPDAAFVNGAALLVDGGMRASLRSFEVAP